MFSDVFEKIPSIRLAKLFSNEFKKDSKLKNLLLKLQYLSQIKKRIFAIYGTDDPEFLLTLVGKKINSHIVLYETYTNLKIIVDEYEKIYNECKERLLRVGCVVEFNKI